MQILNTLRKNRPLVHCITNYVTVNDVANALLAVGASPVMADDENEVEQIVAISNALLINIGTLQHRTIISMKKAAKKANELGVAVTLDPVGAGASELRDEVLLGLLKSVKFTLIRGNTSEISRLLGLLNGENSDRARGVDASEMASVSSEQSRANVAIALARLCGCVVVMSGARDIVSDGESVAIVDGGDEMMAGITGSGCMQGAVLAAFAASAASAGVSVYDAVVQGVRMYSDAGRMAAERTRKNGGANGSFRANFLDAIGMM